MRHYVRFLSLAALVVLLLAALSPIAAFASPHAVASSARIKTITFENGNLTDPATGADRKIGSVQLEANAPLKGVYSAAILNTGSSYLREDFSAVDELYVSFYLRVTSLPKSETRIALIANGEALLGNIRLRPDGKLRLRKGSTQVGADSPALAVGRLYHVGLHQKKGSGANAVLEAYLSSGDSPFDNANKFAASASLSFSNRAARFTIGATSSTPAAIVVDDIRLDTAAPVTPPVPLSFSGPTNYAAGYTPRALDMGDLNGDGKLDIVVANQLAKMPLANP